MEPMSPGLMSCCPLWMRSEHLRSVGSLQPVERILYKLKVIPLKLFYYQTFFETWRNEHYKNAIKIWGHHACLRVSRLLKWGIFTSCTLKV